MKRIILLIAAFIVFSSHDMYLKMDTYYLSPNKPSTIQLFNGTFEKSENIITRDRMQDVSLVGNGQRTLVDTSQWSDQGETTILNFTSGDVGTWLAGVSTKPRNIELSADKFNGYLEHDGVLDMLESRKQNGELDEKAIEKYAKHVKTVFQVGDKKTKDWQTILGYPIEFVPVSNPYEAKVGDNLQVKLLWQGQPLANQLVYAGFGAEGHSHEHVHDVESGDEHSHEDVTQLRTNEEGILTVNLSNEGQWYLRTIYMERSEEAGLTHESNWATLTFAVEPGHSQGFSGYAVYLILGIVLLGGLLFWFTRKGGAF